MVLTTYVSISRLFSFYRCFKYVLIASYTYTRYISFFLFYFIFSSTALLLPTHLPPPSCTHAQSCNPMGFSPPDSSVHGLFQARILEWVAISFSYFLLFKKLYYGKFQTYTRKHNITNPRAPNIQLQKLSVFEKLPFICWRNQVLCIFLIDSLWYSLTCSSNCCISYKLIVRCREMSRFGFKFILASVPHYWCVYLDCT